MFDVVTFGSATADIFVEPQEEHIVQLCTHDGCDDMVAYPSGSKILINKPHFTIGGGGVNTASAFASLGVRAAFGGTVGNDRHGEDVLKALNKRGVVFVGHSVDVPTNMSVILDIHKLHDRTALVYKGSSNEMEFSKLNLDQLHSTWFYFSSHLGKSYRGMLDLMRYARQNGIAVAFNPSSYQAQQGIDSLREPVQLSQLLILNLQEAEMLLGYSGTRQAMCRGLRRAGAEIVVVTDGEQGATMLYADTLYSVQGKHVDAVKDTTGAGDCFASTTVAGLIMGLTPKESTVFGMLHSEHLITEIGATNGFLGRETLLQKLSEDSRDVIEENL